jgi:hypothetical protein
MITNRITDKEYTDNCYQFVEENNIKTDDLLTIINMPENTPCEYINKHIEQYKGIVGNVIKVEGTYPILGVITTFSNYLNQFAIYPYECFTGSINIIKIPKTKQYTQKKIVKKTNCFKANIINNKIVLGNMIVTSKGNKVSNGRLYNHIKLIGV